MQDVQVDKRKNPEIADWAADKEPGDRVCLYGTIKENNDQTLVVTVEEVDEEKPEAEKKEDVGNDGSGDVVDDEMAEEESEV